jgi:hypothetical protein
MREQLKGGSICGTLWCGIEGRGSCDQREEKRQVVIYSPWGSSLSSIVIGLGINPYYPLPNLSLFHGIYPT